jgi:hypothetical protein
VLPFGRLGYEQAPDAIDYAKFYSRSQDAVIRVYDAGGNVIETHEHKGDFRDGEAFCRAGRVFNLSLYRTKVSLTTSQYAQQN